MDTATAALAEQTRAPEHVEVVAPGEDLRGALERGTEWLWLVDGDVAPRPDALERLLEAGDRVQGLPAPVLLAGKVVTPDGSPDPGSLPIVYVFDLDVAVAATERRLLSIRVARRGATLVRRHGLGLGHVPARGDLEWSARLTKREPGMLVPQSVAVRRAPLEPRPELAGMLRLLVSDALKPPERPWFAFRIIEEALGSGRRRAGL